MAKAGIEKPRSSALNPLKLRPENPPAEAGGKEEPAGSGLNMLRLALRQHVLNQETQHRFGGRFLAALSRLFLAPGFSRWDEELLFAIEARLSAASRHA
jgi:hypothetical protein